MRDISRDSCKYLCSKYWNQAANPAGNTHRANAQMQTIRHQEESCPAFRCARVIAIHFAFRSVKLVVLVNVLRFQTLYKLTISGAIVTTFFFLVAAVATRRRRRWRLHHPFRNIGQQIYHCNCSDYAFISR